MNFCCSRSTVPSNIEILLCHQMQIWILTVIKESWSYTQSFTVKCSMVSGLMFSSGRSKKKSTVIFLCIWFYKYSWWECKLVCAATVENSIGAPQKLKIELPSDPAIPLLGIYLQKTKNTNLERHIHPDVHSNIIFNSQDMETT